MGLANCPSRTSPTDSSDEAEKFNLAEADTFEDVEGNMLCTAMRGVTALPWSETPLRMKGKRRNLGDLTSPVAALAAPGRAGKS